MNRRLLIIFFLALLALALMLIGCNTSSLSEQSEEKSITLRDDSGYLLTLTKTPKTIISLTPGNTEILFALGLADRVIGVTTYCNYPPEAEKKPKVGDLTPSVEKIVELGPDLVVAKGSLNGNVIDDLRKMQVPVLCVEPESIDGVFRAIRMIATATGVEAKGEKLISEIQLKIAAVQDKLKSLDPEKRVNVFVEVAADPLYTAGKKTYIDELVTLAGGINIADDIEGYQLYSSETVVEKNPEAILAVDSYYVNKNVIKNRPGWNKIKAVQTERILYELDSDLLNRPGPRVGLAVEKTAQALYPDLFAQIKK